MLPTGDPLGTVVTMLATPFGRLDGLASLCLGWARSPSQWPDHVRGFWLIFRGFSATLCSVFRESVVTIFLRIS